MGMTSGQARGLLARYRAGDATRDEVAAALDLLVHVLSQNERARAKVAELIGPVRRMRAAAEAGEQFLSDTADRWGK